MNVIISGGDKCWEENKMDDIIKSHREGDDYFRLCDEEASLRRCSKWSAKW